MSARPQWGLPPAVVRYLVATVVSTLGGGMAWPFLFIYLNEVRGISTSRSGLVLAVAGVVTLITTPVAGRMIDRVGSRNMMIAANLAQAVAWIAFAGVVSYPAALAVTVINGFGLGLWIPSAHAFVAQAVGPELRSKVSAYTRAAMNLGVGLGGVIGGLIANKADPATYVMLFRINAFSFLVFVAIVATTVRIVGVHSGSGDEVMGAAVGGPTGYRAVLADRFFVRLVLADIAVALGFSLAFEMMPGYASRAGLSERYIGIFFAVNTASVVLLQVPAVRLLARRDRLHSLAAMQALFAAGFVLVFVSVGVRPGVVLGLVCVSMVLFALGECILGAVRQPLTADLAPPALVGRYFGLAGVTFQGGMSLAKVLGGWLLGVNVRALWIVAITIQVVGLIGFLRLGAHIRPDLRFAPSPAPSPAPGVG